MKTRSSLTRTFGSWANIVSAVAASAAAVQRGRAGLSGFGSHGDDAGVGFHGRCRRRHGRNGRRRSPARRTTASAAEIRESRTNSAVSIRANCADLLILDRDPPWTSQHPRRLTRRCWGEFATGALWMSSGRRRVHYPRRWYAKIVRRAPLILVHLRNAEIAGQLR